MKKVVLLVSMMILAVSMASATEDVATMTKNGAKHTARATRMVGHGIGVGARAVGRGFKKFFS